MSSPRSIAIVGVAGRFPGAPDVSALWQNVLAQKCMARDIPVGRWPTRGAEVFSATTGPDRARSAKACLLSDVEPDLRELVVSVGVAAWKSVKGTPAPRARTGVILANIALPTDGASRVARQIAFGALDAKPIEAFPGAMPAGWVAQSLELGGGSFCLDAACASSLYALHLACAELEARRMDAVLAGGVSLPQILYTQVGFSQLLALSPSGRCAPYDNHADGLVVGEGAGIVVLKRLADAERDGDRVLGVIRGIGLSNDVGGSLLSPETEGQLRAMRAAYAQAGWAADDVDLIEGHGTGTPRGDAVELESLTTLWQGHAARGCALGSVKSNIGHLLTAAGVAGLCKVLGALEAKTLPPSANFAASTASPALSKSPFRVLENAEPWQARAPGRPRRAAISGFGFGGINAHVLIEEAAETKQSTRIEVMTPATPPTEIAIVGMGAHVGRLDSLRAFREAVLAGAPIADRRPSARWSGLDPSSAAAARLEHVRGAWIESFEFPNDRFKVPPKDVPALLSQQSLMLKVAAEAIDDAGGLSKTTRLTVGAIVGIGLDLESTAFHLRWVARERVRTLARELGLMLSAAEEDAWVASLADSTSPALDSTRTLGALGGIVPSRVAREFQLGGPSFAVCGDRTSGMRALEVAARMLARGELDAAIVGAVDLAGDARAVSARDALRPFSRQGRARPFDARADGLNVAEGAAAVVVKRLSDARAAGDRIYAVLRGIGAASGHGTDTYVRASLAAQFEAGVAPESIGLVETHGSGVPAEDATEARALCEIFGASSASQRKIVLSSTTAVLGEAGAAASLVQIVKTALCLHCQVMPAIGEVETANDSIDWARSPLSLPREPRHWLQDRADGPRLAQVASIGMDSSCVHAILEASDAPADAHCARPLGERSAALFLLRATNATEVAEETRRLRERVTRSDSSLETLAARWHREGRANRAPIARALVAEDVADLTAQLDRVSGPPVAAVGGELAFVFPGSGNHFAEMGQSLARALPSVYRALDREVQHLAGHLKFEDSPAQVIVSQVAHGVAVSDALRSLGLCPSAFIGYSLGESAALFASRAWRDRDEMFRRTLTSPLFSTELCGDRTVIRQAWGEGADWKVVVVNRPAEAVRAALQATAALLIVNAPGECVVGGRSRDVDQTVRALGCEAIAIEGVPTVHLPVVDPVRAAYRELHTLQTFAPVGARIYSGAWAQAYVPSTSTCADSIVDNAIHGFDFPAVIERAYADGVRVFVEAGPRNSCTRMIARILGDRPHVAVSACHAGQDGFKSLLTAVARAAEAGVAVDLESLYAGVAEAEASPKASAIRIAPGAGRGPYPEPPRQRRSVASAVAAASPVPVRDAVRVPVSDSVAVAAAISVPVAVAATSAVADVTAMSAAHEAFLQFSQRSFAMQAELVARQQALIAQLGSAPPPRVFARALTPPPLTPAPRFDRALCMEFAVGSLEKMLGPKFAAVDGFPSRVRLPDEPLMLVDRIVSVEGEPGVLGPGRVVTEHDVVAGAWYLDAGRAPVCISVEAGQADLFLSGYLGIDLQTRGERVYRLLDAKIVFHRGLPCVGERIRYDIRIDRFICQGDTWLFFFRFDGTIDGAPFITMFDGCAGFFSTDQLASGRGILAQPPIIAPTAPTTGALNDAQVDALRDGDLGAAFGAEFAGMHLAPSLRLPRGRMHLVDRILELDPQGGAAGLGVVFGEADITPDAWFLTCHFPDDPVMPGTLMYECCLHTLRVLLLRMGWHTDDESLDVHYAPVPGVASELRCRGQVTPSTRKVGYRVEIREIHEGDEPYVIATASMFADGNHVVQMEGMSVRMVGLSSATGRGVEEKREAFTRAQIVAYAEGNPSECFGEKYRAFDGDGARRLARLPRDPFLFVDRVVSVDAPPWIVAPGGWVECEYDVPPDAWYFDANRQSTMPFAVLLEAALQPCGWLAAYVGSALLSDSDLHFRNLDGSATQYLEVGRDAGTLTMRARLTKASQAGGMLLQEFDMEVLSRGRKVYAGQTGFGFFPSEALASQVGIRGASIFRDAARSRSFALSREAPLPAQQFSMIDRVTSLDVEGGKMKLGFIAGQKRVDPAEWFFAAHFYQDPVMPGSLGLEAFVQLLKVFARDRFGARVDSHRFQSSALGAAHRWSYRGQVIPSNQEVRVEAHITTIVDGPEPLIVADGQLSVDGRVIYSMNDFALRLVASELG